MCDFEREEIPREYRLVASVEARNRNSIKSKSCGSAMWWGEQDSNLRRLSQQILSAPFDASVSPQSFLEKFKDRGD